MGKVQLGLSGLMSQLPLLSPLLPQPYGRFQMAFANLIWIIKLMSIELFILFFYNLLNLHGICHDYPALISDISTLCSFSFVWLA